MSNSNPTASVGRIENDKKRPWKALAAAFTAGLILALRDYFVGADDIGWPGLLTALGTFVVTFVVTYFTRNPLVATNRPGNL